MSNWQLGPSHPDYGDDIEYGPEPYASQRNPDVRPRSTRAQPSSYHCSQCGAAKTHGRALCPCGAFAKHKGGRPRWA